MYHNTLLGVIVVIDDNNDTTDTCIKNVQSKYRL